MGALQKVRNCGPSNTCPNCLANYATRAIAQHHLAQAYNTGHCPASRARAIHLRSSPSMRCTICSFVADSVLSLLKHMRVHLPRPLPRFLIRSDAGAAVAGTNSSRRHSQNKSAANKQSQRSISARRRWECWRRERVNGEEFSPPPREGQAHAPRAERGASCPPGASERGARGGRHLQLPMRDLLGVYQVLA